MKLKEAIEILSYHQKWRLGKVDEMKYSPKQLTEALDIALKLLNGIFKTQKTDDIL